MKNKSLTENLAELNDIVKQYINARIRLLQVTLLDKFVRGGTFIVTTVIIAMAVAFILLLLTLAFSYWYGENYGSIVEGLLISAGFYAVLTLVIYWLRKPLISNAIVKGCSEMFFNEQDEEPE
jgi:hypothetical protein